MKRTSHDQECGKYCAPSCSHAEFLAWLDAPLTTFEAAEEARFIQRRKALERGDIPA